MADPAYKSERDLSAALGRADQAVADELRVQELLDAVTAIAGDLDLHATLERIVAAAAVLANARYVALGVIDASGEGLVDFITHGMPPVTVASIGPRPRGHGILGLIIDDARPLRLHDLNEHAASYGFPANHPPMQSFLGVPVRVRDRVFGNLYLTDKLEGGDFTLEDEHAVIALAAAAGVAIENAHLYERLRRRERWLTVNAEIQDLLLGHVERRHALGVIASRARDITASDVVLVVLEHDNGDLEVEATAGDAAHLLGTALPRDGSLADVVEHGATVILAEGVQLAGVEGLASALLVPFTGPGGTGGALLIGSKDEKAGRVWDADDVQALRGFAAQAAIGVDRAQAQDDRAALAVLADRYRIAQDLHDLVIQRLFATGLTLHSLARRPEGIAAAAVLKTVVRDLDSTISDVRSAIFDLERGDAKGDLKAQIHTAARAASSDVGPIPHVVCLGPLDSAVPDRIRPHLIAVIVESLSNAARHADATHVELEVRLEGVGPDAEVSVEVRDDGVGFTPAAGGNGLRNMRERATALAGTCDIGSSPGHGTVVRWVAPLDASRG